MVFRTVPGVRRGATLFTCDDGFYYRYISVNSNKSHYTCYKGSCSARVWVKSGGTTPTLNDNFPMHNHVPEPMLELVWSLRERIISRVQQESLPPKTIFDEECTKVPPDVASQVSFGTLESTLQKCRRKTFPRLPASAVEYAEMLNSEEWRERFSKTKSGKLFFRGNISAGGNSNLLFLSENAEELLGSAKEIHIDGTFKTVPSVTGLKQLLVIMAVAFDHAFPVCFVLMEKRLITSYKAVFQFIKSVVPLRNVEHVISDFEKAILRAVREEFPDVEITGCWWHYANCIVKKVKNLRLVPAMRRNPHMKKIMHMCMGLALLPADRIGEGLGEVQRIAHEVGVAGAHHNGLNSLFVYIQTQWIDKVGVDRLSVFNSPRRTNNDSESFNMTLKRVMGHAHPNAWSFVDNLQNMEFTTMANLERCRNALPLSRQKRRKTLIKDTAIRRASTNLASARITVVEFVQTVAAVIGRDVAEIPAADLSDNESDEDDLERPPSPLPVLPLLAVDHEVDVPLPPDYIGPDLTSYRLRKTALLQLHYLQHCPPQHFVEQQLTELREDLADREQEELVEAGDGTPQGQTCTHCMTNKASRINVPCGHWAGCITCCARCIDTPTYFIGHLGLEITECRLPIRCPQCSCLVGKLVRVY